MTSARNRQDRESFVILAYMDEAGGASYAARDKSRFFIRSCVTIKEEEHREIQETLQKVCSVFPERNGRRLPFHAAHMFHGQKLWEGVGYDERLNALASVASILDDRRLSVLYATVDKRRMTQKYKTPLNPVHVLLGADPTTGLSVTSVALFNQIRAVDRIRLIKRLGGVDDETLERVDEISLGLIRLSS